MKNLLLSLLLLSSLCSFAKKKKKPEPAFKKGCVTATLATGYPNLLKYTYQSGSRSLGPFMAAANYQASRRWSFGLQYTYQYSTTGMQTGRVFSVGVTPATIISLYQYERKTTYQSLMATADYCYLNRGRVCLSSGIGLGYAPRPKLTYYFSDNIDHKNDLNSALTSWLPAARLRLVYARVRIAENFGVCGGLGIGTDGLVYLGAHYTFIGRK